MWKLSAWGVVCIDVSVNYVSHLVQCLCIGSIGMRNPYTEKKQKTQEPP